jgi:DNA-binding Xre family transcriptional regulator
MATDRRNNGPAKRLTSEQIKAFKALAQRVDSEEAESIKERARAFFRRHRSARAMVDRLKAQRLKQNITLAELSSRTGIAKSNLSRLENDPRVSPTVETLERYADAIGFSLRLELVEHGKHAA